MKRNTFLKGLLGSLAFGSLSLGTALYASVATLPKSMTAVEGRCRL